MSENGSGSLATETDLIQCSSTSNVVSGNSLSDAIKPLSVDLPCVGHSFLQTQQVFVFLETKKPMAQQNSSEASSTGTLNRGPTISIAEDISGSETAIAAVQSTAPAPTTTVAHERPNAASVVVWKDAAATSCCTISIPCRLLAPTLSKVRDQKYILWAGSADDSELRCYHIVNQEIRSIAVEKSEAVTSPIMSIDCCDDEDYHSLAIGCQDGTVCIMSFSFTTTGDQISLETRTTHSVIVDGPIMSLHLTKTRVLLGSMCGYACQLSCTNDVWDEPRMVVDQFLWDSRYEADDAVLAVEYWMDRVVLGTYSGLVQVHVPVGKSRYAVEWSCRVPDAVHAIAHYQNKLVVTTRTSILMFEAKAIYSAERAKHRLQKILDTNRLSLI